MNDLFYDAVGDEGQKTTLQQLTTQLQIITMATLDKLYQEKLPGTLEDEDLMLKQLLERLFFHTGKNQQC